jgi:hypothetical protein
MEIDNLQEKFMTAINAYHEIAPGLEAEAEGAAVRLLAAHALSVDPGATHMLLESSDQGNFMNGPVQLTDAKGDVISEQEWEAHYNDHVDELSDAASWLTWGHTRWEQFADAAHPYSNMRNGYYALDLRRIAAATTEGE